MVEYLLEVISTDLLMLIEVRGWRIVGVSFMLIYYEQFKLSTRWTPEDDNSGIALLYRTNPKGLMVTWPKDPMKKNTNE